MTKLILVSISVLFAAPLWAQPIPNGAILGGDPSSCKTGVLYYNTAATPPRMFVGTGSIGANTCTFIGVSPAAVQYASTLPGFVAGSCTWPGNNSCPDNTAVVNSWLSAHSASPEHFTFDVFTKIGGLQIPNGSVEIEAIQGGGFFVPSNCDCTAISNTIGSTPYFPVMDPGGTPPTVTTGDIFIHGLKINGNKGTYVSPGSSSNGNVSGNLISIYGTAYSFGYTEYTGPGASYGPWFEGIDLVSVNRVRISDNYIYNTPAYSVRISNAAYVWIERNQIEAAAYATHGDGIHIDGSVSRISISENTFLNLGDDNIAFNAPEGYGGPIGDATVTSNKFYQGYDLARIYPANAANSIGDLYFAENVVINPVGPIYLLSGLGIPSSGTSVASVKCVNNVYGASTYGVVNTIQFTGISVRLMTFTGDTAGFGSAASWLNLATEPGTFDHIQFSGTSIIRFANVAVSYLAFGDNNASTINHLVISDPTETDVAAGYSANPYLVYFGGAGAVGQLDVFASGWKQFTALTDNFSLITDYDCPQCPPVTIANLPASPYSGQVATVSNALAPTFNATVASGGSAVVSVRWNGSNWVVY